MMRLAHVLDGLRCSACHALNMLWLDPVRGIVECNECGQKATVLVDGLGPADTHDLLEPFDDLDGLGSLDWCGGGR